MGEFLVFRRKKVPYFTEWEDSGNFDTLKDAEEYCKKCHEWGFITTIYRELV